MRILRHLATAACIVAMFGFGSPAVAASRPKNATAQCVDGTYSTAKTRTGACSRHGGVQTWYGTEIETPNSAATTKSAPSNATALCNDGTYSTAKTREGACSRHRGVQTWFGDQTSTAAAPVNVPVPAPMPAPTPTNVGMTSSAPTTGQATAKCAVAVLTLSILIVIAALAVIVLNGGRRCIPSVAAAMLLFAIAVARAAPAYDSPTAREFEIFIKYMGHRV